MTPGDWPKGHRPSLAELITSAIAFGAIGAALLGVGMYLWQTPSHGSSLQGCMLDAFETVGAIGSLLAAAGCFRESFIDACAALWGSR